MRSCSMALRPRALTTSWDLAAGIRNRSRPVPVVMFTAHAQDVAEAEEATSDRATQAGFAAILAKPFTLDDLVETVARAVGRSEPFDRSRGAEESRTRELVRALKARGATDVRPSKMREWALFRDHRRCVAPAVLVARPRRLSAGAIRGERRARHDRPIHRSRSCAGTRPALDSQRLRASPPAPGVVGADPMPRACRRGGATAIA